ncbi:MAG: hypothetical protein U0169_15790 [Polyangiaceae bacterium]
MTTVVVAGLALFPSCSGSDPTGFTFVPSSTLLGGIERVRIRVHGSGGRLAFCGDYPVDESRPPGDTIALVEHESAIALAPQGDATSSVRIVVEGFDGTATGLCDDVATLGRVDAERSKPRIRKVVVARYAPGSVLRLGTLFDLSCLDVLSCDETTSTCRGGTCVPATDVEASGIVPGAGCFDVRACPDLARGTALDSPCRFRLPTSETEGYVAVAFDLETGAGTSTGAAVLTPSEFERTGDVVELVGRACSLATDGRVRALYFGSKCSGPKSGQPLCAAVEGGPVSPIARVATDDVARPDAGSPDDATTSDARRDDASNVPTDAASRDATGDATVDAADGSSDAVSDDRPDAPDAGDGGSGDASDGATDSGTDGHDPVLGNGHVGCGGTFGDCTGATPWCCSDTNSCIDTNTSCGHILSCDDASDCPNGSVCCLALGGSPLVSSCTLPQNCSTIQQLCSFDDARCPIAHACSPVRAGAASFQCQPERFEIECAVGVTCVEGEYCCSATRTCGSAVDGPCNATMAPSTRFECDDQSDCGSSKVCCVAEQGGSSACVSPGMCPIGRQLCSTQDIRCPTGFSCQNRAAPVPEQSGCQFRPEGDPPRRR